ncbi:MAG: hypothetical protein ABIH92_03625 [Nanoarchaeota archaeon]
MKRVVLLAFALIFLSGLASASYCITQGPDPRDHSREDSSYLAQHAAPDYRIFSEHYKTCKTSCSRSYCPSTSSTTCKEINYVYYPQLVPEKTVTIQRYIALPPPLPIPPMPYHRHYIRHPRPIPIFLN